MRWKESEKMRKVRFLILIMLSVLSLNSCLVATAIGAAGAGAYYGNYCANNKSATICGGK